MQNTQPLRISVLTENKNLRDCIVSVLPSNEYSLRFYLSDEDALVDAQKQPPELVLSDLLSPNINGLELCRTMRRNFLYRFIPVMIIVGDGQIQDAENLLYSGADDYIAKSALTTELAIKIKLNLFRIARQQDINPLTRLPGQSSLLKELSRRIEAKDTFALYYADLYRFKAYNQRYGFSKGDEALKTVASLIYKTLKECGSPSDFLSHPQNDDFIFITLPDSIDAIAPAITSGFEDAIKSLYEPPDLKRGHIILKNRKGELENFPLMRLSIGIVTNESYTFSNPGQVIQVATELRDFCHQNFEQSAFVRDRRKSYSFH